MRDLAIKRQYLFAALFFIVVLIYGPLLRKHYALDTYVVEAYGNQWEEQQQIQLGRFLPGMTFKVLTALGLNAAVYQSISTFLAICLLAFSIYLLILLFSELPEKKNNRTFFLICLSCIVSLCNVFMLHWFLFPEVVGFMMSALVLSILAVWVFLRSSNIAVWLSSYALLLAALSFYQAAGAFFVIFGMLHIGVRRSKQSIVSALRGFAAVLVVYGLAGVSNMILIKLLVHPTDRTNFQYWSPLSNVHGIVDSLRLKLHNTNLGAAPVYAFGSVIVLLLLCVAILLWRSSDRQGLLRALFVLGSVTVCSFVSAVAPHLLTSTVDMSPRSIVALMSLPGVIGLFTALQPQFLNTRSYYYLLVGFLMIFFLSNTYITYAVEKSRFATNRLDREIAEMVYHEILDYEKKTGDTVKQIAFRNDVSPTLCYKGLICYGNFRAMQRDWTVVPLLDIVSARNFVEAGIPDAVYNTYFKGKDWDSFNKEQIVIQGDTLFLMLY